MIKQVRKRQLKYEKHRLTDLFNDIFFFEDPFRNTISFSPCQNLVCACNDSLPTTFACRLYRIEMDEMTSPKIDG
jgi:hypothetical protein